MTVKELREALSQCDDGAEIIRFYEGDDGSTQMAPIVFLYVTASGEVALEDSI